MYVSLAIPALSCDYSVHSSYAQRTAFNLTIDVDRRCNASLLLELSGIMSYERVQLWDECEGSKASRGIQPASSQIELCVPLQFGRLVEPTGRVAM